MIKRLILKNMTLLPILLFGLSAQAADTIKDIIVKDNQRVESLTIESYLDVAKGEEFDRNKINSSMKKMFSTELFSDVSILREGDALVVTVKENPIVNKVVFEGNKRIKDDQITPELSLEPRSVYTRAKVQNDVKRIQNLYRKSGRFSVTVTPKVVQLDQNRVDLVFEIQEGKKATISKIYFVGNDFYKSNKLREILNTKESRWYSFYSGNDTYDPDRVAFDKEVLRKFYAARGFADFKVTSAIAEITKDKKSFILTFIVEEGERYKFGEINIESTLPDLQSEQQLREVIETKPDDTFNADQIEASVDAITGKLNDIGYAFVDVKTSFERNVQDRIMSLTYNISEGPKVYIDRINIAGNVRTLDKVIRREFRIAEGDPYNAAKLRRSQQRIRNLGFFEDVDITSTKSTSPDKADINVNVSEKPTGELNFGAGYSTTEGALGNVSVRERNLLGKGQDLRVAFQKSSRGSQIDLGFTEPYFLGKDLAAGFDLFDVTRDQGSESSFDSKTKGGTLRAGYSLTEHLRHSVRYSLRTVDVTDIAPGASTFVVRQEGENTTSLVGHTLLYDLRDNKFEPTQGYYISFSQDIAGVGGDSKFFKNELKSAYYYPIYRDDFIFSLSGKGGYMFGLDDQDVRINERFFIGGNTIRGFDVAGIGPRDRTTDDALGGNTYYATSAEIAFPLGLPEELGFTGSVFVDAGSLFDSDDSGPTVQDESSVRAAAGFGVSWSSPLGPIRVDIANAFAKEAYDDTERVRFNFGTRF